MKGLWGYVKGSLALQAKALPRIYCAPFVGAVRTTLEEIRKMDDEIDAFTARYKKECEEETARMSERSTTAG